MLSSVKVSNNSRIVVVGASDTGTSLIESLLTIKDINFTHITLLAPGGLTTMHILKPEDHLKAMSTNYTLEELRNLMIDARVSVLDAKMVELDKKNKRIKLDKNAYLPYDILVVAVGLIDTEL
jgi:NADH dehydrogenase FAD-containing subunit